MPLVRCFSVLIVGLLVFGALLGSVDPAGAPAAAGSRAIELRTGARAVREVPAPRVPRLPTGWRSFSDAPIVLSRSGGFANLDATSWPFRQSTRGGWITNIPARGAGIALHLSRSGHAASCGYPVPLAPGYRLTSQRAIRLREFSVGSSKGNPRNPHDLRLRLNLDHLYRLDAIVEYGSPHPTPALRRAVATALRRVVLPTWPRGC